jgi:hypothetical protein
MGCNSLIDPYRSAYENAHGKMPPEVKEEAQGVFRVASRGNVVTPNELSK